MALGCVRGPAATTAGVEDKAYTAAPSMKARITAGAVTALRHDISIYRASDPRRLAGRPYVRGDLIRNEGRVRRHAAGGGGQSGVITDGSDNRSAEDDSDVMCLPVIDERDAEIAGEGDAFDLH
jgi:hypothetical protein